MSSCPARLGPLIFLLLCAALAHAESPGPVPEYGKPLGLGAGVILPSHPGTEAWVTANLRLRVKEHLLLEPEVGYWSRQADRNDTLSHVLNLGVNAVFTTHGSPVSVWAGAGLGIHLLRYAAWIASEPFTYVYPTIALFTGFDYRVAQRVTLYGAARIDFSIEDDPNGAKFYAGVRFHL